MSPLKLRKKPLWRQPEVIKLSWVPSITMRLLSSLCWSFCLGCVFKRHQKVANLSMTYTFSGLCANSHELREQSLLVIRRHLIVLQKTFFFFKLSHVSNKITAVWTSFADRDKCSVAKWVVFMHLWGFARIPVPAWGFALTELKGTKFSLV